MSAAKHVLCALASWALLGTAAAATDLPPAGKVVRLVVPYAAGGAADMLARKMAPDLSARIGRTVIVENRAGAGGSIGTEGVVRSDADGSSILLHSGAIAVEPAFKPGLSYDALRDLVPVTTAVAGPFVVLVNNKVPARNLAELIAYAKAHPGELNYGSAGIGTSVHMTTEYLKASAGIDMVHVPFRGSSPALAAAMGNQIEVIIDPLATGRIPVQSGKLRALGLTTAARSNLWPELETVNEAGVKDFDAVVWYGLFVPAKTPPAVVDRLNRELVEIIVQPDMTAWLRDQGLEPIADTPAAARARMAAEVQRWKLVVKDNNIQVE